MIRVGLTEIMLFLTPFVLYGDPGPLEGK